MRILKYATLTRRWVPLFVLAGLAACAAASPRQAEDDDEVRKRHTAEHAAAATELSAFEDASCRAVTHDERAKCPLLGAVVAANDLEDGIALRLSMHAHTRDVINQSRCHIAFGRAHGAHHMDDCPLYVEGVRLRPAEEGRTIELTVDDPGKLPELWRRVHDHSGW